MKKLTTIVLGTAVALNGCSMFRQKTRTDMYKKIQSHQEIVLDTARGYADIRDGYEVRVIRTALESGKAELQELYEALTDKQKDEIAIKRLGELELEERLRLTAPEGFDSAMKNALENNVNKKASLEKVYGNLNAQRNSVPNNPSSTAYILGGN